MKKFIFAFLVLSASINFSQESIGFLSRTSFGLYGGINFISVKQGWGTFLFEGKTHLSEKYLFKFSFGYDKLESHNKYNVNSYHYYTIENIESYEAISYTVNSIDYQIIPISIGLHYNINFSSFHPYVFSEIGYNFIDSKTYKTEYSIQNTYDKYDDLPSSNRYIDSLPRGSYRIAIGFGVNYQLSAVFGLDIRFLTQIDSEILNSQKLLLGITF